MASINDRVVADIAWPDWVKPGRMCTSRVQDCTALPQGTLLLSHGFLAADPSARGFLAAYTLACSAYSGRSCSWRAVPGPWAGNLSYSFRLDRPGGVQPARDGCARDGGRGGGGGGSGNASVT